MICSHAADKNLLIGLAGTLKNVEPALAKAKSYDDLKERIWGLRPYQVVARIDLSMVKRISIDEKASKNKSAVLVFETGITKTPVRIGDLMTQTVRAELRDAKCTELELSKRYENVNQMKADLLN